MVYRAMKKHPFDNIRKFILMLTAILTIAILIYIIHKAYVALTSLDKDILVPMLAGMFTVIASVVSFLFSRHVERSREIERQVREKKIPFYDDIVRLFFESVFCPEPLKKRMSDREISQKMRDFSVHALIWGSDEVYLKWARLVRAMQSSLNSEETEQVVEAKMKPLGEFLLAVREEIGHRNRGLDSLEIWRPFVNDFDDVISRLKQDRERSG